MKTGVVICPGRGSFTTAELGYLSRITQTTWAGSIITIDVVAWGITDARLEALRPIRPRGTRGDHASALIYACAIGDFCPDRPGTM